MLAMQNRRFSRRGATSILIRVMHPKEPTMREGPTIALPARQLFAIPDAGAVQILCTAGCLWLTLDEDGRDVVLYPGDSFEDASGRRALVYAFEASAFTLLAQRRSAGRPASAKGGRFPIVWAATRTAGSG
ncbi:MAG: DUF2917 domain-containing protein [Comamonadaceae bacterium]|nr:MAG: DUF2917 domain-containing protein [Comamonadaceae bacterium]